jgi:hypothetical protein
MANKNVLDLRVAAKTAKKVICALLAAIIVVGAIPLTAQQTAAADYSTKDSFEDYVVAHLKNFEPFINVTYYADKNNWDNNDIKAEYHDILTKHPELFYVDNYGAKQLKVDDEGTLDPSTGKISKMMTISNIGYICTESEYTTTLKPKFDAKTKEALAYVTDDMTVVEKCLALHDYIVLNTEFYLAKNDNYNAYDVLVGGKGMCEGYAMAYMHLLNQYKIENIMITKADKSHAWNYVKVGSKWYHVDTTWDDKLVSSKDQYGVVLHENFMISDEMARKTGHTKEKLANGNADPNGTADWDVGDLPAATSTTYDKRFWRTVRSAMVKVDGLWYYAAMDTKSPAHASNYKSLTGSDRTNNYYKMYTYIRSYDWSTGKAKNVTRLQATWFTKGGEAKASSKTWIDQIYVSVDKYKDKVYFNTTKSIYSYDPAAKKLAKVTTSGSVDTKTSKYIYGFKVSGNRLIYTLKTSYSQANSLKAKTLAA